MHSAEYARTCQLEKILNKHKRLSILDRLGNDKIADQPTKPAVHTASRAQVTTKPVLSKQPQQYQTKDYGGKILQEAMEQHSVGSDQHNETLRGLEMGKATDLQRDLQFGVGINTPATTGRTLIAQVLKTARDDQFRRRVGLTHTPLGGNRTPTLGSFWTSARDSSVLQNYSPEQSCFHTDDSRPNTKQ